MNAQEQHAESRLIILGQVSLSCYAVTGAVVHEVLERLGHRVEVRQGPHEEMFPLLAQGAIDLMAAGLASRGSCCLLEPLRRSSRRGREVLRRRALFLGRARLHS